MQLSAPQRHTRQLFMDDYLIKSIVGLKRTVNQPEKYSGNPILQADTPWESRCQVYGTVLFDEERNVFRVWYLTTPRDRGLKPLKLNGHERAPHTTLCAYAESEDGIHWNKPLLDQFPYDGDRKNNLIDIGKWNCEGISVICDANEKDENRRWKSVYWDHGSGGWTVRNGGPFCEAGPNDGFCVAFSPDGLKWTPLDTNPVISQYCDTNQNVIYDEKIGKYVAFSRLGFGRRLARSESTDFANWTEPQLVMECDEADGPNTQIYGAGVDIYEGIYIAMVWIYREGGDGKIDTQLATSRDGINWERTGDRAVWLPLGDDDSWEGGMIRSCERIIIRDDKLYIYYCGVHGPHGGPKFKNVVRKHSSAIGLCIQRRDGFMSLDAGNDEGYILTKPFVLPEGDLYLNADARDGRVKAEIVDDDGLPLSGYYSSQPIAGDNLSTMVKWTDGNLGNIAGKRARLRLYAQNAKLYSYWFE